MGVREKGLGAAAGKGEKGLRATPLEALQTPPALLESDELPSPPLELSLERRGRKGSSPPLTVASRTYLPRAPSGKLKKSWGGFRLDGAVSSLIETGPAKASGLLRTAAH